MLQSSEWAPANGVNEIIIIIIFSNSRLCGWCRSSSAEWMVNMSASQYPNWSHQFVSITVWGELVWGIPHRWGRIPLSIFQGPVLQDWSLTGFQQLPAAARASDKDFLPAIVQGPRPSFLHSCSSESDATFLHWSPLILCIVLNITVAEDHGGWGLQQGLGTDIYMLHPTSVWEPLVNQPTNKKSYYHLIGQNSTSLS